MEDFIEGMLTLFTKSYEHLVKFVFDIYDFNRDGLICKEDIQVVFSYIPLRKQSVHYDEEKEEFIQQIESQNELHLYIEKLFANYFEISECQFISSLETTCSEVFLFVILNFNFLVDCFSFREKTF